MEKAITNAQLRKIHVLARECGMDDDLLHSHLVVLSGKDSLRELTVKEGISLIDSLEGKGIRKGEEKATYRQMGYIHGLMKKCGWVTDGGQPDMERLDRFQQSPKAGFNLGSHKWLTRRQASSLIEALKQMSERKTVAGK